MSAERQKNEAYLQQIGQDIVVDLWLLVKSLRLVELLMGGVSED